VLGEDRVEGRLGRAEQRGVPVERRGHERGRVLAPERHRARRVRLPERLGCGPAQLRGEAAEAHDLGVEDVDEPGRAAPQHRRAFGNGRTRIGVDERFDEVGARVVRLGSAEQAGDGAAVHGHVPAAARPARTRHRRIAEGRVPELAARARRAGDRAAVVDEDPADADLDRHEKD